MRVFQFAFLVMLLLPNTALASTCISPPPEESYKRATMIFEGQVIDGMGGADCSGKKMLMRVDKVYKGLPEKEVYVITAGTCVAMGPYLTKGEKYMVFAGEKGVDGFGLYGCGATYNLMDEKREPNPVIEAQLKQLAAIDKAIQNQPDDAVQLLKIKAEHLIYWQDYQQAAVVLKKLVGDYPDDSWAANELLSVLFKQRRAEDIWALYQSNARRHFLAFEWGNMLRVEAAVAVSYAALTLGKQPEDGFYFHLNDIELSNVRMPSTKLNGLSLNEVAFNDSDFKGADFSSAKLKNTRFENTDLSEANFKGTFSTEIGFGGQLARANFTEAMLFRINMGYGTAADALFTKARMADVDFNHMDFSGADFTDSSISRGLFQSTDFSKAKLSGISLKGIIYDCQTRWPEGFDPKAAGAVPQGDCTVAKVENPQDLPGYPESLKSTELEGKDFSGQRIALAIKDGKQDRNTWRGKNLKNSNFSEIIGGGSTDFSFSDLTGANFSWSWPASSFYAAVLDSANFSYANLGNGNFTSITAKAADFSGAVLERTQFAKASLERAKFNGARMTYASFTEVKAAGADFSDARMMATELLQSDFSGAIFRGADLRHASTQQGDLYASYSRSRNETPSQPVLFRNADFSKARLESANVSGGDFTGAKLSGTKLSLARYDCKTIWPEGFDPAPQGALLIGGACEGKTVTAPAIAKLDLKGARLSGAVLGSIDLSGKDLSRAKIESTDFSQSKLNKTIMTMAVFDCDTKWPEGFDPLTAGAVLSKTTDEQCFSRYGRAKLSGKDLSGMELFETDFSKADLQGTNLSNAEMGRADLYAADLSGADLRGADLNMANFNDAVLTGAKYDCNTQFPRGFTPADRGMVEVKAEICGKKPKPSIAVTMLLQDWRQPEALEGATIENETMHWFYPQSGMKDSTFKSCDMRRAQLARQGIGSIKFLNTNLGKSLFNDSTLNEVDFKGSKLNGADFSKTRLKNVNFSGADISGTTFEGATFENVTWEGAIYDCQTKGAPLPPKECGK